MNSIIQSSTTLKQFLFYSIIMLLSISSTHAQEKLIFRDGEEKLVRVIEQGSMSISYKDLESADTSIIHKATSMKVKRLIYKNGEIVNFKKDHTYIKVEDRDYKRNFVAINAFDLLIRKLSFYYQFTPQNYNLTIGIPISTSFNALSGNYKDYGIGGYYDRGTWLSTGIDLIYFPFSKELYGFLLGPAFKFGFTRYETYNYQSPNSTSIEDGNFFGLYLKTGYYWNKSSFGTSIFLDIGTEKTKNPIYYSGTNNHYQFSFILQINIGLTY